MEIAANRKSERNNYQKQRIQNFREFEKKIKVLKVKTPMTITFEPASNSEKHIASEVITISDTETSTDMEIPVNSKTKINNHRKQRKDHNIREFKKKIKVLTAKKPVTVTCTSAAEPKKDIAKAYLIKPLGGQNIAPGLIMVPDTETVTEMETPARKRRNMQNIGKAGKKIKVLTARKPVTVAYTPAAEPKKAFAKAYLRKSFGGPIIAPGLIMVPDTETATEMEIPARQRLNIQNIGEAEKKIKVIEVKKPVTVTYMPAAELISKPFGGQSIVPRLIMVPDTETVTEMEIPGIQQNIQTIGELGKKIKVLKAKKPVTATFTPAAEGIKDITESYQQKKSGEQIIATEEMVIADTETLIETEALINDHQTQQIVQNTGNELATQSKAFPVALKLVTIQYMPLAQDAFNIDKTYEINKSGKQSIASGDYITPEVKAILKDVNESSSTYITTFTNFVMGGLIKTPQNVQLLNEILKLLIVRKFNNIYSDNNS